MLKYALENISTAIYILKSNIGKKIEIITEISDNIFFPIIFTEKLLQDRDFIHFP